MIRFGVLSFLFSAVLACSLGHAAEPAGDAFVRVSPRDRRYFELTNGDPYVPVGLNMIAPPGNDLDGMAEWMQKLSANGGNYIRVWLGHPFFDVEHDRSGHYDPQRSERIERMLELAEQHGIRVKMCIESFRHFGTRDQQWSEKSLHLKENGGPAEDIADFFDGKESRRQFKQKLAWLSDRFGDDPAVFGWELWNEVNAVAGGDYMTWTRIMLAELQRRFPKNLCMQSLGSFDSKWPVDHYRRLSGMESNDVAQVHRYLDLGARLEVCHGPVADLAIDAVRTIQSYDPKRPILLAESGAVEPRHTGPFKLYDEDEAGIILHDVIFAPFFAGAAGSGHIWHWGRYVDKMGLWYHFGRFSEAIEGIDPPAEKFEYVEIPHARLRILVLKGRRHILAWCRDTQNTWRTELKQGKEPEEISGARLDLAGHVGSLDGMRVRTYDPWQNHWQKAKPDGATVPLPTFSRSIVVRIER